MDRSSRPIEYLQVRRRLLRYKNDARKQLKRILHDNELEGSEGLLPYPSIQVPQGQDKYYFHGRTASFY